MVSFSTLNARIEVIIGARLFRLVRYVFSGGTAAASNFIMLYLLVQFIHMYYLYASILAFIVSLAVSFLLHKFFTFRDNAMHEVHYQVVRYLVVIFANLVLNTIIVYLLVEKFAVWYLLAQVLAAVVIMVTSYIGYKFYVFREDTLSSV